MAYPTLSTWPLDSNFWLPLTEETLQRFHAHDNLAYVKDATHADGAITTIWVLSSADDVTRPMATAPREPKPSHRPEPFQFEIHPSQVQSQSQ